MTKTVFRRLRTLEEAQRVYSVAQEGMRYKELLLAKLERMARAERADPNWREPTSEETWERHRRLGEFFAARGWHKAAQTVLGSHSAAR